MRDPILNKALEAYDGSKIIIRPSSVDGFNACSRQWAMTFIGGVPSIPGGRAAIGTAIHAGIEQGWKESIAAKAKAFNSIKSLQELAADNLIATDQEYDIQWDEGENMSTAIAEVTAGVSVFASDIVPFVDIPIAVEERYTIPISYHPIIEALSGTVDYISPDTIADVKTSKRKPVPESYVTQQSIYKLLAEANGRTVKHNMIHGVVLKAKPDGHVLALTPNVERAKHAVNTILDVTEVFHEQKVAPDVLFRGNPKYYLCDKRYCAFYNTCPYVK